MCWKIFLSLAFVSVCTGYNCYDRREDRPIQDGTTYNQTRIMEGSTLTGVYKCNCNNRFIRCVAVDIPCYDSEARQHVPKFEKFPVRHCAPYDSGCSKEETIVYKCTCFGRKREFGDCQPASGCIDTRPERGYKYVAALQQYVTRESRNYSYAECTCSSGEYNVPKEGSCKRYNPSASENRPYYPQYPVFPRSRPSPIANTPRTTKFTHRPIATSRLTTSTRPSTTRPTRPTIRPTTTKRVKFVAVSKLPSPTTTHLIGKDDNREKCWNIATNSSVQHGERYMKRVGRKKYSCKCNSGMPVECRKARYCFLSAARVYIEENKSYIFQKRVDLSYRCTCRSKISQMVMMIRCQKMKN